MFSAGGLIGVFSMGVIVLGCAFPASGRMSVGGAGELVVSLAVLLRIEMFCISLLTTGVVAASFPFGVCGRLNLFASGDDGGVLFVGWWVVV